MSTTLHLVYVYLGQNTLLHAVCNATRRLDTIFYFSYTTLFEKKKKPFAKSFCIFDRASLKPKSVQKKKTYYNSWQILISGFFFSSVIITIRKIP